jgi:hypothetical protein
LIKYFKFFSEKDIYKFEQNKPSENIYETNIHRNGKERVIIEREEDFKRNYTFIPHLNDKSLKIAEKNSNLVDYL